MMNALILTGIPQVGRGFSPDRSLSPTDSESTELVGAEAPTHLREGSAKHL
jgi:hypothetical protein